MNTSQSHKVLVVAARLTGAALLLLAIFSLFTSPRPTIAVLLATLGLIALALSAQQ